VHKQINKQIFNATHLNSKFGHQSEHLGRILQHLTFTKQNASGFSIPGTKPVQADCIRLLHLKGVSLSKIFSNSFLV